ncbi:FxLYD domain-containing protein [Haloarcula sp. Atlit-7R]|uniref:FxLYD domain-containing protein n=1 Tax=Haloarcula sp. Atlit-7R TaxID=2282125 RepID=UPI0011C44FC9|nr:FxLYD domain-containing protein [Haloarcula sp. Atlit-7R]
MNRRTAIKGLATAMVGTTLSLAGCSSSGGGGGVDIEQNIEYAAEQDEYVEVTDVTEEATQVNGSEGVAVSGTAKNTSDDTAFIELVMTFVDPEGTTLGETSAFPKGSTSPNEPGEAAEFEAAIAESPGDIAEYTIEVRAT